MAADFDNTKAEKKESYVAVVKLPLEFAYRPPLKSYYPDTHTARGATLINICPDKDGKLVKAVEVVESSGDRNLDEAAVRWATDARYKPRKNPLDGTPYVSCDHLRVNFAGP